MDATWGRASEVVALGADGLQVEIADGQDDARLQPGAPHQAPRRADRRLGGPRGREQGELQRQQQGPREAAHGPGPLGPARRRRGGRGAPRAEAGTGGAGTPRAGLPLGSASPPPALCGRPRGGAGWSWALRTEEGGRWAGPPVPPASSAAWRAGIVGLAKRDRG